MTEMLSAGVYIEENDNSTIVPVVSNSVAGFSGNFKMGNVGELGLVTSVDDLITSYGYPDDDNYNDWFQAWNFLQYGNKLLISRAANEDGTDTLLDSTYFEEVVENGIFTITTDSDTATYSSTSTYYTSYTSTSTIQGYYLSTTDLSDNSSNNSYSYSIVDNDSDGSLGTISSTTFVDINGTTQTIKGATVYKFTHEDNDDNQVFYRFSLAIEGDVTEDLPLFTSITVASSDGSVSQTIAADDAFNINYWDGTTELFWSLDETILIAETDTEGYTFTMEITL